MAELCNGRDERGRFAKGNVGGPGNPFARQTAKFRSVLVSAVSEADFKAVTAKLVEMARWGDLGAIKLLFAYLVGKPTTPVDPDRLDIEEWMILKEEADMAKEEDMPKVIESEVPQLVSPLGREVKPLLKTADGEPAEQPEVACEQPTGRVAEEVLWDRHGTCAWGTPRDADGAAEREKPRVSPSRNGVLTEGGSEIGTGVGQGGTPPGSDGGEVEKPEKSRVSPSGNGVLTEGRDGLASAGQTVEGESPQPRRAGPVGPDETKALVWAIREFVSRQSVNPAP